MLMINLVSLLNHTLAKMSFKISLAVWSKKVNIVVMWRKMHFNKEFMIIKKKKENFQNPTKNYICDIDYIDNDVKVRDNCHIAGKYSVISMLS